MSGTAGSSGRRRRASSSAALRAEPGHVEAVAGGDEAVLGRDAVEPGVELAVADLDDPVAVGADEVVVVRVAAPAVAELATVVRERVDGAGAREQGERPVDGREADPLAAAAETLVERLCRHVVALAHELGEDVDPLARGAYAETADEGLGPPRRGDGA